MRPTRALTISIARPWEVVYSFISQPLNFTKWGPMDGAEMTYLGGTDYLVKFESRPVVIRFTAPNAFGVGDYWAFAQGSSNPGPVNPVRVVPNGDGCALLVLLIQRDGVSDEQFASEAEWLKSDLEVLRSMLEA
jgi:hypothetical protein